jgi:hypothetical protein
MCSERGQQGWAVRECSRNEHLRPESHHINCIHLAVKGGDVIIAVKCNISLYVIKQA